MFGVSEDSCCSSAGFGASLASCARSSVARVVLLFLVLVGVLASALVLAVPLGCSTNVTDLLRGRRFASGKSAGSGGGVDGLLPVRTYTVDSTDPGVHLSGLRVIGPQYPHICCDGVTQSRCT